MRIIDQHVTISGFQLFKKLKAKYYDMGYKSGRWNGYQEGYEKGKEHGYNSGFAEATNGGIILNQYGMFIAKSGEIYEPVINGIKQLREPKYDEKE